MLRRRCCDEPRPATVVGCVENVVIHLVFSVSVYTCLYVTIDSQCVGEDCSADQVVSVSHGLFTVSVRATTADPGILDCSDARDA